MLVTHQLSQRTRQVSKELAWSIYIIFGTSIRCDTSGAHWSAQCSRARLKAVCSENQAAVSSATRPVRHRRCPVLAETAVPRAPTRYHASVQLSNVFHKYISAMLAFFKVFFINHCACSPLWTRPICICKVNQHLVALEHRIV